MCRGVITELWIFCTRRLNILFSALHKIVQVPWVVYGSGPLIFELFEKRTLLKASCLSFVKKPSLYFNWSIKLFVFLLWEASHVAILSQSGMWFANSVLRSRPAGSPAQIPWATSVGKQKPLSPLMTPIETINFFKNIFLIVVIKNLNFLNEESLLFKHLEGNERKLINTLFKLMVGCWIRSTLK